MSVFINGMEMPVCHFKTSESYNIHGFWMVYPDGKSKLHIMVGSDHWACEVISVPDHGRLIDADADPSEYVTVWDCECSEFGRQTVMAVDDLAYLPTIIPADKEGE